MTDGECIMFDSVKNEWTNSGCESIIDNNRFLKCQCDGIDRNKVTKYSVVSVEKKKKKGKNENGGEIAGIVIGVLSFFALAFAAFFYLKKHPKTSHDLELK